MTVKPLVVITIPNIGNNEEMVNVLKVVKEAFDGQYLHLVVSVDEELCPLPTFQVFYEKDFNKVKYEELKQIILDKLK